MIMFSELLSQNSDITKHCKHSCLKYSGIYITVAQTTNVHCAILQCINRKLLSISQVFGLIVVIGGFVCAILSVQFDHFKFTHAILGAVVMVLGLQQPLNALW